MAKLKHGAHQCELTSPEIIADGICDICLKDEPVEFACDRCNFDLCRPCSELPLMVWHDFHPEHPLGICVAKKDGNTSRYKLCSGCGDLFCESFYYKCKECEIYLDLGCAIRNNIGRSWDAKETLHYSHAHLLRRCKPGPDAEGSCLMCELPLPPSHICFGCVKCYLFVHERCLNLPREIRHPVHPAHPLIRLDFTHNCGTGKRCDACKHCINGAPLGCPECNFHLHMRCADSLLRGLVHPRHPHKLFYIPSYRPFICQICNSGNSEPFYHCMECRMDFHFRCLWIPMYVVKNSAQLRFLGITAYVPKKSYHIHPLVCKEFVPEDDSLEYCGVCETMVKAGPLAYCCIECDFVAHLECILNQGAAPSPLYLKDLYSCGESITKPADQDHECGTKELEQKLLVNDIQHNHVLRYDDVENFFNCGICHGIVEPGGSWKCKTCGFGAHDYCVTLRKPSYHEFHLNHPLTLLPSYPAGMVMNCDTCKRRIDFFNLFCRLCNFIICIECMLRAKRFVGEVNRGQKFMRDTREKCLNRRHTLAQVMVSRSYQVTCTLCNDKLSGIILSCTQCKDIYHPRCIELGRRQLYSNPLHPNHVLMMKSTSGSTKCTACKMDMTKYGFGCYYCPVSFHLKCIEAVGISRQIECHKHYLYNFWSDDSSFTQPCNVCNTPCGASFYVCNYCKLSTHVECIGFPDNVKNQRHQHTVQRAYTSQLYTKSCCSLCGLDIKYPDHDLYYPCNHCKDVFHTKCILSMVEREAATKEEQTNDIHLMYIELDLSDMIKEEGGEKDNDEEDGDEKDDDTS